MIIFNKFILWQSIVGICLAYIVIITGAWFFVSSSDKTTGNVFFIIGLSLMVGSTAWYLAALRERNKKKASN